MKEKRLEENMTECSCLRRKVKGIFFLLLFNLPLLTKEHYLTFKLERKNLKQNIHTLYFAISHLKIYPEEIILNIHSNLNKRNAMFLLFLVTSYSKEDIQNR